MLNLTVFRQVQQLCPRYDFEKCVDRNYSGRKREMTPWRYFQIMVLSQLCGSGSLRDIAMILSSQIERNYHHGLKIFGKSTIARVSEQFDYKIFADYAQILLKQCRRQAPKHGFRFNNKLYSVDSTTITLYLSLFNWADFRQHKGGVKIHTQLDHNGGLPSILSVTVAKRNDTTQAKLVQAEKGDIVVFDRGYNWYEWFKSLDNKGVYFVTRLKDGTPYTVLKRNKVLSKKDIIRDEIIQLTNVKYPLKLRLVVYLDSQTNEEYAYLTNHFKFAARTIADIYKDRWLIESFFKDLKQNLKIKTFMGTSENAVKAQIYIAFCVYLLLKILQFSGNLSHSIGKIRNVLVTALFTTKTFQSLFRNKIEDEPATSQQLPLLLT